MKFSKVSLKDLALYIRRGISPKYVESDGILVLNQKCVRNQTIDFDPARLTSGLVKIPVEKRLCSGDILVNSTGAGTVGRVARYKGIEPVVTADSHLTIVRPNPDVVDPGYLGYYLGWKESIIEGMAKGATNQLELSVASLAELQINMPTLLEQRRISTMLSGYDDLIENNRRRMKLLEESARLLFQEWFVRLRFAGHKRVKVKEGVPVGWERMPLAELTTFLKRGITPRYDDDAEGLVINQKCIRDGRVTLTLARRQSKDVPEERQVQVGDVLVNSTGEGTLGRVAQLSVAAPNCTVDTHVTIVRPQPDLAPHFFGMSVMAWEPQFSTMGRGATNQTELSPAQIGAVSILVPPPDLAREFDTFAAPIFAQVNNLTAQNEKLKTARDLLLPRLMSGEVEV